MPVIEVTRQHALGVEQARHAVEAVAERLQGDLKARYRWQGDDLCFECPGADGRISVTGSQVCVSVQLSWLLTPAKNGIERSIKAYLDEYLA